MPTDIQIQAKAKLKMKALGIGALEPWPEAYFSNSLGVEFKYTNEQTKEFVLDESARYWLLKGGEGGGKSLHGVIKNLEKLRRGCSGIMGCVSADTLINGVPIADRNKPEEVDTLLGKRLATSSFLKGKADLFRVVTQSGGQVLVTSAHRFLTPTGWCQLQSLHVGDLIAVDDTLHERPLFEKSQGFQDYYYSGFHPYDELSSILEQHNLDILQLLVSLVRVFFLSPDHLNRVYIDSFLNQTCLGVFLNPSLLPFYSYELYLYLFRTFSEYPLATFRFGSLLKLLQDLDFSPEGISYEKLNNLFVLEQLKLSLMNNRFYRLFLEAQNLSCIDFLLSYNRNFSFDLLAYNYYNVKYSKIQDISFQYFGDFYDITVPGIGHYAAQGILHHNSPDLEHFKKSLWPVFRDWCPWHRVIKRQQYRREPGWEASKTFTMVFKNEVGGYSELICGGFKESEIGSWEGPNVNFAHFDEARRHRTDSALKVLMGRIRIEGPNGEPPQLYFTTTPRKHWLYSYFGPLIADDPKADFKRKAKVATVRTEENKHLYEGFALDRASSLGELEASETIEGEWVDLEEDNKFVNILWWDSCKEKLPPLTANEPVVLALDGAKGGQTLNPDSFAINAVSRHPNNNEHTAVRYTEIWEPEGGKLFDYRPVKEAIIRFCERYAVIEVTYDPYQLHDLATTLGNEGVAFFKEFIQGSGARYIADKQLQDNIISRKISHDGNDTLRKHIDNAGYQDIGEGKIKIVKREPSSKVDAATCLSIANHRILYYNI